MFTFAALFGTKLNGALLVRDSENSWPARLDVMQLSMAAM